MLYVAEDRAQTSLDGFWETLTKEQVASIEAVDRVRRRENKTLRAAGDDRLTGTRYDWLRHPASMEPKDRQEFAALRNCNLKTARAWALKETATGEHPDLLAVWKLSHATRSG